MCEGTVTESDYFGRFRQKEQNRLVDVKINSDGGVPKTLVEKAVALKKDAERKAKREGDPFQRYDEIWCVFDIDQHPNLDDAKQQAKAHGIRLAYSNPCFELWLLLHFQDRSAHLERDDAQSLCRTHMPGYVKLVPFDTLYPHYDKAVSRARALEKWHKEASTPGGNPCTAVHLVTERIRELGREASLRHIFTGSLGR